MDTRVGLKPFVAGVVFSLLVGFSFLSVKVCIQVASTIEILAFRYDFAFIGVLALVIFKVAKPEMKGKRPTALLLSAGFYIAFMIIQAVGLIFSTSIESAIIFSIIPIIARIIAGFFLKEKSTLRQNIFVVLSVAALIFMIVMSAGDLTANVAGIAILIVSSVCMALSNVLMRYVRTEFNPFSVTFLISAIGFAAFNAGYIFYMLYMSGSAAGYFAPCMDIRFIVATAYLGIPCIVISSWLMSYMLAHMEAIKATIFGNLSTAVSITAGIAVLREPFAIYDLICILMIIAGVIGVSYVGKNVRGA